VGHGGHHLFVVPTLDLVVVINTGLYKGSLQRVLPSAILNQFVLKAGRHPRDASRDCDCRYYGLGSRATSPRRRGDCTAGVVARCACGGERTVDSSVLGKSHQAIAEAIAGQTLSNERVSMDGRLVPRPLDRVASRVLHFGLD